MNYFNTPNLPEIHKQLFMILILFQQEMKHLDFEYSQRFVSGNAGNINNFYLLLLWNNDH